MWFVEMISRTELERAIFAAGHSIWIGGAMGILLWVCLRLMPARYAGLRYAMTLGALGLLVVSLPATYTVLSRGGGTTPAVVITGGQMQPLVAPISVAPVLPVAQGRPVEAGGQTDWVQIAALIWAAGFVTMLIRMAVQLRGTRRLLDGAQDASQTTAGQTVGRLLQRLQWRAPLRVLLTPQLNSPAVLGIFRPVLLIPPAIACELTPPQLESILLHELAHIRRYDYLVNIGQLLIEALLFFNPAVWLISRQVRIEREACCDAFAARITGEPLRYAEVLGAVMGRLGGVSGAMAATGEGSGHALDRVRRLLVPGYRPGLRLSGPVLTGMVIAGLLLFACLWQVTGAAVAAGGEIGSKATATMAVAGGDAGSQVQVCVETRIMTIEKELLPPDIYDPATKQWRSGLLDDRQVAALLYRPMHDQGGTVTTAPRVTVEDGGEASTEVWTPHQYRDVKATTRPDGSQEYSPTLSDTWDGVKQNVTAKTDAGHQVTSVKFKLTIQKLLGMEKVQTKPTNPEDKPIEFERPQLQTMQIDTNVTVPSGKTALLGGQEIAAEYEGRGKVNVVVAVLVKPVIFIGDPSTRPSVALPRAGKAAAAAATQTSGEDTGKVNPSIIAADNPGEGMYYVGGQVARAGVYSPDGRQITLKQAVVSAGMNSGMTLPGAQVDLIRRLPGNKERITAIDLAAIFRGTQPDRYLQSDDLLVVRSAPQTPAPAQPTASPDVQPATTSGITLDIIPADNPGQGEYYMGGHVVRVGVHSMADQQITIKQAVVAAGGLDAEATAGVQVDLIRRTPGSKERITTIDLDALFKGTQPDRYLQPNDLLQVRNNRPATVPTKAPTEQGGNAVAPTTAPVFALAKKGTVEQVREAIAAGADVNAKDQYGRTPLMSAARNPNPEVIAALLNAGAEVNAKAKALAGVTALMVAAEMNSNPEVVAALLKAGAEVNAKMDGGETPLMGAAGRNSNPEVIAALLKAGAEVNAKTDDGTTPLLMAFLGNNNPEVIAVLLKAGADVNAKHKMGWTPVMLAAKLSRDAKVIAALVKAGADVNAKDANGLSVLEYGRMNKNPEVLEELAKAGAK